MTPEQTREAAAVMLAAEYDEYGNCLNVQFEFKDDLKNDWMDNTNPRWDWESCKYRIKPKPELKKGQIIEVSDDGVHWKLRRFSCWGVNQRVFVHDGHPNNDVAWEMWRLPE